MKKLLLISVLTGGVLFAPQAQAINEEWSAVAGFVGGLLVANASDRETRVVVREERYQRPTTPYYRARPHRSTRRHCDRTVKRSYRFTGLRDLPMSEIVVPSGYYETRTERYWVPGRRIITRDHCGRKAIRYTQGYYDYREIKVWVEYRSAHSSTW